MVGIDVAFDNPIFACLEIDYEVFIINQLIFQFILFYLIKIFVGS